MIAKTLNRPQINTNEHGSDLLRILAWMLEVSGLHKRYGDLVAVHEVSFTARPGEMVGLLGPNGAGKTTTVSMIAGLLAPDRGEVRIEGGVVRGETDPVKLRLGL